MKNKRDLKYFENLKYNILLKKKNEIFILFIPELSIIVEDYDLSIAYNKIQEEKSKYFSNIIELNAQDTVTVPLPIVIKKQVFRDLSIFIVKSFIIMISLLVIVLFSRPLITSYVDNSINNAQAKAIKRVKRNSNKLFNRIDNLNEDDIAEIKKTIIKLKPLVNEIKVVLGDEKNDENKKESTTIQK